MRNRNASLRVNYERIYSQKGQSKVVNLAPCSWMARPRQSVRLRGTRAQ